MPNKAPFTSKARHEKPSTQPLASGRPRRRSARLGSFLEDDSLDESGEGLQACMQDMGRRVNVKEEAEQLHAVAGLHHGEVNHNTATSATPRSTFGMGDHTAHVSAAQFAGAGDAAGAAARFASMPPDAQFAPPFGLPPGGGGFMGPYGGMFGGMGGLPPGIGMPQDASGQGQMDQRTFYAFLQGMAFAETRRAAAMHGQQQAQAQAQPGPSSATQAPAGIDPAMMAYISTMMGSNPAQFPAMAGMPSGLSGNLPGGMPGNMAAADFNMPWANAAHMPTMPLAPATHGGVGVGVASNVAVSTAPGVGASDVMSELAASLSPPRGKGRTSS